MSVENHRKKNDETRVKAETSLLGATSPMVVTSPMAETNPTGVTSPEAEERDLGVLVEINPTIVAVVWVG